MRLSRAFYVSVIGLFVIALGFTVRLGREVLTPILLAILLNLLFSRSVRAMRQRGIPGPAGAAIVLCACAFLAFGTVLGLGRPAAAWVARAPQGVAKVQRLALDIRRRVRPVVEIAKKVEDVTALEPRVATREVTIAKPNAADVAIERTWSLLAGGLVTFFLAWLLLAPGDVFVEKLVALLPTRREKAQVLRLAREVESSISRYLAGITVINVGLGAATALAMWALGLPNPLLWGALAALLNFMPYLGPLILTALLGLAGVMTFDTPLRMALPAVAFAALNLLESNVVTPKLLERWLSINAVASFVGVIVLWELLGIAGALMAVPLLVSVKILCQHVESLNPVASFLSS
jgi:predicted PurR-regulated permease PerM